MSGNAVVDLVYALDLDLVSTLVEEFEALVLKQGSDGALAASDGAPAPPDGAPAAPDGVPGLPTIRRMFGTCTKEFPVRMSAKPGSEMTKIARLSMFLDVKEGIIEQLRNCVQASLEKKEVGKNDFTKEKVLTKVADYYGVSIGVTRKVVKRGDAGEFTSKPRSGRPTSFTQEGLQHVVQVSQKACGLSALALHAKLSEAPVPGFLRKGEPATPSPSALQRLKRHKDLEVGTMETVPMISPSNVPLRLDFATFHSSLCGDYKEMQTLEQLTYFCRTLEQFIHVDETYVVYAAGTGKALRFKAKRGANGEDEIHAENQAEWPKILNALKSHQPKILLITFVTCPHLLNPMEKGPQYCVVRNGVVCVWRVSAEGVQRNGMPAFVDATVNSANYRYMVNKVATEMFPKYKLGEPYEKCRADQIPVALTTAQIAKAKAEEKKELRLHKLPTQAMMMAEVQYAIDKMDEVEMGAVLAFREAQWEKLKSAVGNNLPNTMKAKVMPFLNGVETLAWAVLKTDNDARARQKGNRLSLEERFAGRSIQKHLPLVHDYLHLGEHDEDWAVNVIQEEIDKPATTRNAMKELMGRSVPLMVEAQLKWERGDITKEQFKQAMDDGEFPMFFLQQDSAGGHGLARGSVSEDQRLMKEELAALGIYAFEQPPHSPCLNLNDSGFNYSLQAKVRALGGEMVQPENSTVNLVKKTMWLVVVNEIAHYKPKKLFNMAVQRTVLLREIVKAQGHETSENYHTGVRSFFNTH